MNSTMPLFQKLNKKRQGDIKVKLWLLDKEIALSLKKEHALQLPSKLYKELLECQSCIRAFMANSIELSAYDLFLEASSAVYYSKKHALHFSQQDQVLPQSANSQNNILEFKRN